MGKRIVSPLLRPPVKMTGAEISALRERMALSQASMAALLGLSVTQYRNLEKDRRAAGQLATRVLIWLRQGFKPPELIQLRKINRTTIPDREILGDRVLLQGPGPDAR